MKNLLISFLVLATMASCGKNNSVGAPSSLTSPLTVTGAAETQLGSVIDNNQFGNGMATYYETWNQLLAHMPNVTFDYGTVASSAQNNNCKFDVKGYCLLSVSTSFTNTTTATVTRSVLYSSVDLTAKKNELKNLLNSRLYLYQFGTQYQIDTLDKRYYIDTSLPMQANPVLIMNKDGSSERYLGVR